MYTTESNTTDGTRVLKTFRTTVYCFNRDYQRLQNSIGRKNFYITFCVTRCLLYFTKTKRVCNLRTEFQMFITNNNKWIQLPMEKMQYLVWFVCKNSKYLIIKFFSLLSLQLKILLHYLNKIQILDLKFTFLNGRVVHNFFQQV